LTVSPSSTPSSLPTKTPSSSPSISYEPTAGTTLSPSESPTYSFEPTAYPTGSENSVYDDQPCRSDVECKNPISSCLDFICKPGVSTILSHHNQSLLTQVLN
jgi:hypothetical protein